MSVEREKERKKKWNIKFIIILCSIRSVQEANRKDAGNSSVVCISLDTWTRTQSRAHCGTFNACWNFSSVAFLYRQSHWKPFPFFSSSSMWPRCKEKKRRDRESHVTTIVSSFAHSSFADSILTHDLAYFHTASFRSHYMTSVGWICVHFGQHTKHKHDSIEIYPSSQPSSAKIRQLRIDFQFGIAFLSPCKVSIINVHVCVCVYLWIKSSFLCR